MSDNESTLYLKQGKTGLQFFISLYVDDMLVTSSNEEVVTQLKKNTESLFEMLDFGTMKYFLGMEISQNCTNIFIS